MSTDGVEVTVTSKEIEEDRQPNWFTELSETVPVPGVNHST